MILQESVFFIILLEGFIESYLGLPQPWHPRGHTGCRKDKGGSNTQPVIAFEGDVNVTERYQQPELDNLLHAAAPACWLLPWALLAGTW